MRHLTPDIEIDWVHIDEHNEVLEALALAREVLSDILAGKTVKPSEIDHVLQEIEEYV